MRHLPDFVPHLRNIWLLLSASSLLLAHEMLSHDSTAIDAPPMISRMRSKIEITSADQEVLASATNANSEPSVPHTRPATPRSITHTHDEDFSDEDSDNNNHHHHKNGTAEKNDAKD